MIGFITIAMSNIWLGAIQLFLLICSVLLVAYSYCAKCPSSQEKCGHPQIGFLRKFVPEREKSKYQIKDYLSLTPLIVVGIVIPQYWLWQNKALFVVFWALNITVLIGILTRLCTNCENKNCKMNRNQIIETIK